MARHKEKGRLLPARGKNYGVEEGEPWEEEDEDESDGDGHNRTGLSRKTRYLLLALCLLAVAATALAVIAAVANAANGASASTAPTSPDTEGAEDPYEGAGGGGEYYGGSDSYETDPYASETSRAPTEAPTVYLGGAGGGGGAGAELPGGLGTVSAGRDPEIPRDKVATSSFDVFAATASRPVWESADATVRFDYRPEALDILEPETRLSGEVPLGEYLRGRVVKEGRPLIRYYPGNLPFLLVCIHTTTINWRPWMKNWPPSRRACTSAKCKTLEAWRNLQAIPDEDFDTLSDSKIKARMMNGINGDVQPSVPFGDGSGEHCLRTFEYMGEKTGNYPHLIYTDIPKFLLDFNRQPANKYLSVPGTLNGAGLAEVNPETWASYYDMINFAREAKNVIARQWGGGWGIAFHTQGGSRLASTGIGQKGTYQRVYSNPELTAAQVNTVTAPHSLMAYDYLERGLSPWEALYGRFALGEQLSLRGVGSAPSRAFQYVMNGNSPMCYCGSTAWEGRFGSASYSDAKQLNRRVLLGDVKDRPSEEWYVGRWNSVIMEILGKFVLPGGNARERLSVALAETLIDLAIDLYGTGIRRRNDYTKPFKSLGTIYDTAVPATTCADGSASLIETVAAPEQFYLLHECMDVCAGLDGCKFVVMDTSMATSSKRPCHFYRTCEKRTRKRFSTIFDVEAYRAGA